MNDLPPEKKQNIEPAKLTPMQSKVRIATLLLVIISLIAFLLYQWESGSVAEKFISKAFVDRRYFPALLSMIVVIVWCAWQIWIELFGNNKDSQQKFMVVALAVCVGLGALHYYTNSDARFYNEKFWATATLSDVELVSDDALKPGNTNGSVIMWAAAGATDPEIIRALVKRGADVNEADIHFSATPISAAAVDSETPAIIDVLVEYGADVNHTVGSNNKSPLILAAELNFNSAIAARLIHHGADIDYRDKKGRSALDRAASFKNKAVVDLLKQVKLEATLATD